MTIEFAGSPFDVPITWTMGGTTVAIATTSFAGPSRAGFGATESQFQAVLPRKGTVQELYVVTNGAQPGAGSFVITMRINGVSKTLTLTIAAGAAAGTFTDLTHTEVVAAGDKISFQCQNNDAGAVSATTGSIGFIYRMSR